MGVALNGVSVFRADSFITYPRATQAFTHKQSDINAQKFGIPIKYNPEADPQLWADRREFLRSLLGR